MVVFTLVIGMRSVCATLKERTQPMNAAQVAVIQTYVDTVSPEVPEERDAAVVYARCQDAETGQFEDHCRSCPRKTTTAPPPASSPLFTHIFTASPEGGTAAPPAVTEDIIVEPNNG